MLRFTLLFLIFQASLAVFPAAAGAQAACDPNSVECR